MVLLVVLLAPLLPLLAVSVVCYFLMEPPADDGDDDGRWQAGENHSNLVPVAGSIRVVFVGL